MSLLAFALQISALTEKVQRVTKQLASERSSAELEKKQSQDRASQRSGENKKLALEVSKLKVAFPEQFTFVSVTLPHT